MAKAFWQTITLGLPAFSPRYDAFCMVAISLPVWLPKVEQSASFHGSKARTLPCQRRAISR